MAKATDRSTSTSVPTQMTSDGLTALARRLRAYVGRMRNPAAKAVIGADIIVAADVLDRLVELHQHAQAGEQACVDAVRKLIGGR